MSSQVVRVQGFSKGSLSGIGKETERANVNHRNPDIDPERTHLNMVYKQTEHGFYAEWNKIVSDLNIQWKETKKGVAFEGMVITAERSFFEEKFGWKPEEPMSLELRDFWDEVYEWAIQQIGYQGTDRNILSAIVHADETSLHLQIYYLPVTEKWQEKIYAKDENGKVLRNAKGSPIQAKDENGKAAFRRVEDLSAPKLSRTEFWRARGGNTSYRQMQDSFHEEIGKCYGLERGEVGSDAKHRTKAQWEKTQLEAEVQPYREMKAGIDEIDSTGTKKLPFGYVSVKEKDFAVLQEQAKSYVANRDEIDNLRERQSAVRERELEVQYQFDVLRTRNSEVDQKLDYLNRRIESVNQSYQEQLDINQILHSTRGELTKEKKKTSSLEAEIEALKAENSSLRDELARVKESFTKQIEALTERFRGAYEHLMNVVKAVGMLKYDREKDQNGNYIYGKYGISNLSKAQEKLIDGIAKYGSKWARQDGFPDFAEEMDKRVSISTGIRDIVEPKSRTKGRGYGE